MRIRAWIFPSFEHDLIRKPVSTFRDHALIRVAGGDLAGNMGALFEVAADDDAGLRRAAAVALLEAVIAAVKTRHHLIVAVAGGRFGLWFAMPSKMLERLVGEHVEIAFQPEAC